MSSVIMAWAAGDVQKKKHIFRVWCQNDFLKSLTLP